MKRVFQALPAFAVALFAACGQGGGSNHDGESGGTSFGTAGDKFAPDASPGGDSGQSGAGGSTAASGGSSTGNSGGSSAGSSAAGGSSSSGGAGSCASAPIVLGDGGAITCEFAMTTTFDPSRINIAIDTGGASATVCHTMKETGCTGQGWYWTYEHNIALCDQSCAALQAGGTLVAVLGCATAACSSGGCTYASGYCSWETSSSCCSGRCDGDSCCSGLWGECSNEGFGCCEGTCQQGYCRCPESTMQCGSSCVTMGDQNCGECGRVCSGGKTCQGGNCQCPAGMTDCDGTCVDLTTDASNCGACGEICRSDEICQGSCKCPGALVDCDGACVDTTCDENNCTGCGIVCGVGESCLPAYYPNPAGCRCTGNYQDCDTDGDCEDLMTDENNCGYCTHVCMGQKQCVSGGCQ